MLQIRVKINLASVLRVCVCCVYVVYVCVFVFTFLKWNLPQSTFGTRLSQYEYVNWLHLGQVPILIPKTAAQQLSFQQGLDWANLHFRSCIYGSCTIGIWDFPCTNACLNRIIYTISFNTKRYKKRYNYSFGSQREKEILHLLVHFQDGCNRQGWAILKSGAKSQASRARSPMMSSSRPSTWANLQCFTQVH